MSSNQVALRVLVPSRDDQLAMLIESRCRHIGINTTVVRFAGVDQLSMLVEANPFCCIMGTISSEWEQGRSLFDDLDLKQIIWPPVYGVCQEVYSDTKLLQLANVGVLWASDLDTLMSSSQLDLVLSGSAWVRHYGFLFQKISRKTLREGDLLIVCTAEQGQYGRVHWRGGNLVNADFGQWRGLEALYELALIENWRIDVHSVFIDPEFEALNIPVLQAINSLVETAQHRRQVLPMGRPPGMTKELSSKMVMGLRDHLVPDKKEAPKSSLSAVESSRSDTETLVGFAQMEQLGGIFDEPATDIAVEQGVGATNTDYVQTKQNKLETSGMGESRLADFLVGVGGAFGGAVISTDGAYTAVEGDFDVDTVAAVASMSTEYLGAIANALSIQGLEIACFSGNASTVFLKREGDSFLVCYGSVVKNPGITAKKLGS